MIVWLTGPPGVGKSTVGALLGRKTGRPFVDLDAEIERREGRSIAEIFASDGEEMFRSLESELIERFAVDADQNIVIATGGGSVVDPRNQDLMRSSGFRIGLTASVTTLCNRISESAHRPLFDASPTCEQLELLVEEREPFYRDVDFAIIAERDPAAVVDEISERIESAESIDWAFDWSSGIHCTGLSAHRTPYSLIQVVRKEARGSRIFLVTDENLKYYYPETIAQLTGADGVSFVVEPGEGSKSFSNVERIVERLSTEEFDRGDILLSFGGGVVTDLGSFIASIYMRGIRSVIVPTSLLCMVDATVGGKTAVNCNGVRNLVGTFSPAHRIYLVPSFLATLPIEEVRSGLVESLKMGILASPTLLSLVECAQSERYFDRYSDLVRVSIETKIGLIGDDLHDHGSRRLLNFGHTIGHGLEGAQPGSWRHGDAVAVGMIAETLLGLRHRSEPISECRASNIIETILPFTVNPELATPEAPEILRMVSRDKKASGSRPQFVVPTGEDAWDEMAQFEEDRIVEAMHDAYDRVREFHERTTSEGKR